LREFFPAETDIAEHDKGLDSPPPHTAGENDRSEITKFAEVLIISGCNGLFHDSLSSLLVTTPTVSLK